MSISACHFCDPVKSLNLAGVAQFRNGKLPAAINRFETAIRQANKENRNTDTLFYNLTLAHIQHNDHIEAFRNFSLIGSTGCPDYLSILAYLNATNGYTDEAISLYQEYLISHPSDFTALYNIGILYYGKQDYASAQDYFTTALKKKTYWKAYLSLANINMMDGNLAEATKNYEKAYSLNKSDAECKISYARILSKTGEIRKATPLFRQLLHKKAYASAAYTGLGDCDYRKKNFDEAANNYCKAVEKDQFNEYAHVGLGNIALQKSKLEEARNFYDKAISANPFFAYAYEKRGITNFRLNGYKAAMDDFATILMIRPNYTFSFDAYISKGYSAFNLGLYDEALNNFKKAINLNPELATGYDGAGCTMFELGQYFKAAEYLKVAATKDSENDVILTNYGNALYQICQFDSAKVQFDNARKINPVNLHAWNGSGICAYQMDSFRLSVRYLEHATELDSTDSRLYLNLITSRGLFIKHLREKQVVDSAAINQQLALMAKDIHSYQQDRQDSTILFVNLGYLHLNWGYPDSAAWSYNRIVTSYGQKYKLNNLAVLELVGISPDKGTATTLLHEAKEADSWHIYNTPDVNLALIGNTPYDYNNSPDPWIRKYIERDKYISTYFYYSLMRYTPPPVYHDLEIEIRPANLKYAAPALHSIVYRDYGICKKFTPFFPKAVRVKDIALQRTSYKCPVF